MKKFKKLTTAMLIAACAVCGAFGVSALEANVAAANTSGSYSDSSSSVVGCAHKAPTNKEDYIFYQEATCYSEGKAIYLCEECYEVVEIDIPANHDWEITTTATCDQGGITTEICNDCGEIEQYIVDALGHDKNFDKESEHYIGSTKATCDADAYCGRCGESYCIDIWDTDENGDIYIDIVYHELKVMSAEEATCTEDGHTEYVYCANCGYKSSYLVIEAFGHNFKPINEEKITCLGKLKATHYCAAGCNTYAIVEDGEYVEYDMFNPDIYDADIMSIGHTIEYDGGCTCGKYWEDDLPDDVYYVDGVVYETYSDYVSSLDELVLDGETKLEDGESFVIDVSANLTISGDGSFKNAVEGEAALINYGTLTIESGTFLNGNIEEQRSAVIKNYGTLTIEGGTFGSDLNRGAAVENYGKLIINGGEFAAIDRSHASNGYAYVFINKEGTMTINNAKVAGNPNGIFAADGGVIEVYGGNYQMGDGAANTWHVAYTWEGTVNIYDGTYNWTQCSWNGASLNNGDVTIYGGDWNEDPSAWLAEGYFVLETAGGKYLVLEDENTEQVEDQIVLEEGEDFNGNGATIDASNVESGSDCALTTTGGMVENVTVLGAFRGVGTGSSGTYGLTSDLYIDNVTIDGGVYALNVGTGNGYNMYVSNSELYGWSSYSGLSVAYFDNVIFGKGTTNYQYVRIYDDSYFYGCTFEEGFELGVNSDGFENGPLYIGLNDCYYGDTLITAENFVYFLAIQDHADEDWDALKECTVVIDGVEVDFETTYIFTAEDLLAFAEAVNAGNRYSGKLVKLMADIDLEDELWTPIGANGDDASKKFAGTFDGNEFTISNLYVEQEAGYHAAGFFGAVNGTVCNLTIDGAYVENLSSGAATVNGTAILAGSTVSGATISNITVKNATVVGNRYVGGIVGYMDGTVENCTVEVVKIIVTPDNLTGSYDNGDKVGGVVGYMNTMSERVSGNVVSNVEITAYRDIGGVVGYARKEILNNTVSNVIITVNNDHNYKNYTKAEDYDVGAIVGESASGAVVENNSESGYEEFIKIFSSVGIQNAVNNVDIGETVELELSEGEYKLPDVSNKTVVITGTEDTIINMEQSKAFHGADFGFNGVTIQGQESGNYAGMQHVNAIEYNGCVIEGKITLYGESIIFNDCDFYNNNDYSVWTWGGKYVEFNNCNFYSGGKALLLYGYGPTELVVNNCNFYDNDTLDTDKAAIEIGNDYNGTKFELVINNITVEGFAPGKNTDSYVWANKNENKFSADDTDDNDTLVVTIDGEEVYNS